MCRRQIKTNLLSADMMNYTVSDAIRLWPMEYGYSSLSSEMTLVEVRLLRVSAARTLDDNIGSVTGSSDTLIDALLLNQLR
jgi:hypothetical protein